MGTLHIEDLPRGAKREAYQGGNKGGTKEGLLSGAKKGSYQEGSKKGTNGGFTKRGTK